MTDAARLLVAPGNLNLQELIEQVADRTNAGMSDRHLVSASAVERAVRAVFEVIEESLVSGTQVRIRDFGTFSVVQRAERQARNVVQGTRIHVPATISPVFRPAERLKTRISASA